MGRDRQGLGQRTQFGEGQHRMLLRPAPAAHGGIIRRDPHEGNGPAGTALRAASTRATLDADPPA